MLIDLHVHTTRYSASCSALHPSDLIRAAGSRGLGGVVLSEHHGQWTPAEIAALDHEGLLLIPAREVDQGWHHVLVLGIGGPLPQTPDGPALARAVHQKGGAAILAHPLRWRSLESFRRADLLQDWRAFHGVEALCGSQSHEECRLALAMCREAGLKICGGSDAHHPGAVGLFATRFLDPITSEAELVAALREGRFEPWGEERLDQN